MKQNNNLVHLYYKVNYNMQESKPLFLVYAHIRRIKKAIVHYVPIENHNDAM